MRRREGSSDLDLEPAIGRENARRADAAPTLASLAEGRRRAGDPAAALDLAREALAEDPDAVDARATALLALLDLGRDAEVREELESLVAPPAADAADADGEEALPLDVLADDELEQAFSEATPEADAMHDANEVAFEAMRAVELDLPELAPFQTQTMAALLERQGDHEGARAIREALERSAPRERVRSGDRRLEDRIRTLERWLERTRRGTA